MVTYDIITVVFETEVNMLELQAISMRQLAHDVGKIIIINNASSPDLVAVVNERIQKEVIPQYGHLASKVEVYNVIDMLGQCYDDLGWEAQQLLKLLAADFVESPLTMILDAKNFFINRCTADYLLVDNKPKRETKPFLPWSKSYLQNACDMFQLNKIQRKDMYENFKEIHTPFIIWSDTFKSINNELVKLTNKSLREWFTINPLITFEFYVLEAYIAKHHGLNNYFFDEGCNSFFRIHRSEYVKMSEEQKIQEGTAWIDHGIFDTVEQSINQINKIQKNISDYPRANDSLI